jgi:hypothetical protein
MLHFNSRSCLFATAVAASVSPVAFACDWVYQASLQTLPQAQSWPFLGTAHANATAQSGTLVYGPASFGGTTYWESNVPGNGMDFSKITWSMTANVRLTGTSNGNVSGFQRGGFVLLLGDNAGRYIVADFGSNSVGLRNDNNGTSDPQAAFTLSGNFHQVTLEAGPGGGRLLIDGNEVLTLALGSGGNVNIAAFGDASILASSELTEIQWVKLVPSADPCPGDLNCDIVVDDLDFSIFASAYNLLVCDDPAMPISCPADLNNDGFVDDTDFAVFAAAYNNLICE